VFEAEKAVVAAENEKHLIELRELEERLRNDFSQARHMCLMNLFRLVLFLLFV